MSSFFQQYSQSINKFYHEFIVIPYSSIGIFFLCAIQPNTNLRIDNSWQGLIRATLLYSVAITSTISYYTSN